VESNKEEKPKAHQQIKFIIYQFITLQMESYSCISNSSQISATGTVSCLTNICNILHIPITSLLGNLEKSPWISLNDSTELQTVAALPKYLLNSMHSTRYKFQPFHYEGNIYKVTQYTVQFICYMTVVTICGFTKTFTFYMKSVITIP
jgi:hypothetical protein